MNLKYLNNFLALAKYRNFSEAAEECYLSQSSFSKRIMQLENELGVKLFERTTRHVTLTPYGEIYLQYAQKIDTLAKQATDEINRRHANESGLIIGGIPSINEYGILDVITGFIATTHVPCQVKTAPSEELEAMLTDKQIDFAFVKNVQNATPLIQLSYTEDQLVAVLPTNHPLANQKAIQISALAGADFIFQPVHSRPYDLCIQLCQANGFTPNVVYADRIVENILNFVKKGLGVSLLMGKLVTETDDVVALPIVPAVMANINLCYLQDDVLNDYQQQFITYFNHRNQG